MRDETREEIRRQISMGWKVCGAMSCIEAGESVCKKASKTGVRQMPIGTHLLFQSHRLIRIGS